MINGHLWIERGDGAARAHHVAIAGKPCLAIVDGRRQRAIAVRAVGAGLDRFVPQADVVPAASLSDAEEREYARLDRALAGTIGDARKLRRFNALRLRALLFPTGDE